MNVVIEGPDGSGKSTLASYIASELGWDVIASRGPAKSREEFRSRAVSCLHRVNAVFDRHPCVSERIYGTMRGDMMLEPDIEEWLYSSRPFIIYYPLPLIGAHHNLKAHDTPEHLELLNVKARDIKRAYDRWAMSRANFIYRRGEPKPPVVHLIRAWFAIGAQS
jgi:hypothetical protein